ncbi:unnamed protein product [Linum trigynum]|uniref:Uncharacterized protein n=1 Tax=Linum trigynum TaxID=586398 RepID=A0AAV2F9F0_9ROSI
MLFSSGSSLVSCCSDVLRLNEAFRIPSPVHRRQTSFSKQSPSRRCVLLPRRSRCPLRLRLRTVAVAYMTRSLDLPSNPSDAPSLLPISVINGHRRSGRHVPVTVKSAHRCQELPFEVTSQPPSRQAISTPVVVIYRRHPSATAVASQPPSRQAISIPVVVIYRRHPSATAASSQPPLMSAIAASFVVASQNMSLLQLHCKPHHRRSPAPVPSSQQNNMAMVISCLVFLEAIEQGFSSAII